MSPRRMVKVLLTVALCAAAALVPVTTGPATAATPSFTFGVNGDTGMTPQTTATLQAIAANKPDVFFNMGDLSYQDPTVTSEAAWCTYVKNIVGATYPYQLVSGNHEDNGPDGLISKFAQCLPDRLGVTGTYAKQYYVDYPPANPLVRFVMISPGNIYPPATTPLTYKAGTAEYSWTAATIDGARAAGIPFVVVGMHYYCLNISGHACPIKPDIMNLLVSKKVDVYLQAHDHAYTRTKQLALSSGCTTVSTTSYNSACVADQGTSAYTAGKGTVIATVGMGGQNINKEYLTDPAAPYFAAAMGSNLNPTFGFLRFTATPTQLSAQFVRSSGGSFTDAFTLTRPGGTADSTPPETTITSAPSGSTTATTASVSFTSSEPGSTFTCSLDGASPTTCTSPVTYSGLAAGTHVVSVAATDAATNTDPTPATASWTVTSSSSTSLFTDGFESGTLAAWTPTTAGDGTAAAQQTTVATGAWAAKLTESATSGSKAYLRKALAADQSNATVEFDVQVAAEGASGGNVPLLRLFNASGTRVLSLYRQNLSSNKVYVNAGTATLTSGTLPLGTWAHVKVRYTAGTGNGVLEVSLNGTIVYTTNAATLTAFRTVQVGNDTSGQAGTVFADNMTVTTP